MSESPKVIYACNDCDYKSEYKQNLVRHQKSHEKKSKNPPELSEKAQELIKIVKEKKDKKEKPPPVIKETKEEDLIVDESINIDDYIQSRVEEMVKSQNIPVKVPKHLMTQIMSSSGASFLAGAIASFLLAQNIPRIMALISKNYLKGGSIIQTPTPTPTPTQNPPPVIPAMTDVKESP